MDRSRLLQLVARLGSEFGRREMRDHLRRLRIYYLAVRHGLAVGRHAVEVKWDEDFVIEWLSLLGVPPYADGYEVRSRHSRCATCPGDATTRRTIIVFTGGAKFRCENCGAVWVERG